MADGNPVKTSSRSPTCPKPSTSARPPSQIRAVSSAPVSPARMSSARQRTVRKLKYVQPAVFGLMPSPAFRTRPPPCPPPEGGGNWGPPPEGEEDWGPSREGWEEESLTVRGLEDTRDFAPGRGRRDRRSRPPGAACPAPPPASPQNPDRGAPAGSRRCRGHRRPTGRRQPRARSPSSRPERRSPDRSRPGGHP